MVIKGEGKQFDSLSSVVRLSEEDKFLIS